MTVIPSTDIFNLYILFSQTRPRGDVYVMHLCMRAMLFKISRALNGKKGNEKAAAIRDFHTGKAGY